eukprot:jgi/Mesvir1/23493/Mv22336-RA.1
MHQMQYAVRHASGAVEVAAARANMPSKAFASVGRNSVGDFCPCMNTTNRRALRRPLPSIADGNAAFWRHRGSHTQASPLAGGDRILPRDARSCRHYLVVHASSRSPREIGPDDEGDGRPPSVFGNPSGRPRPRLSRPRPSTMPQVPKLPSLPRLPTFTLPPWLALIVRAVTRVASIPLVRESLLLAYRCAIALVGAMCIAGTALQYIPLETLPLTVDDEQRIYKVHGGQPMVPQEWILNGRLPTRPGRLGDLVTFTEEMSDIRDAAERDLPAGMSVGMSIFDPETGEYFERNAIETFPAASLIKLPVLICFLQDVDMGRASLEDLLEMRSDLIGGESGGMQYKPVGTKFDALEVAYQMIVVSDNTATNLLVDRVGGMGVVNERFGSWGLEDTVLRAPLPDLDGRNTTSARDLSYLLALLDSGHLLSLPSRDLAMEILRTTINDSLFASQTVVAPDAKVAHKTGDIGFAVGDTGIIACPNGRRFVATMIVRRPFNDQRAGEYIRSVMRVAYKRLSGKRPAYATRPLPGGAMLSSAQGQR